MRNDSPRAANRVTMAPMGKVVIKVPHIVWRDGRPRFVAGPRLRELGMAGRDLKHQDGRWFSLEEAGAESRKIEAQARHLEAVRPRKRAVAVVRDKAAGVVASFTVGNAVADYIERSRASKKWAGATRKGYQLSSRQIAEDDVELWAMPLAKLTKGRVLRWVGEVEEKRGLATARACAALLRAALGHAVDTDRILVNPALKLRLETPEGRIRVGSPEEMRALIAAADAAGRPEIGDSVMLGLFTGLRQGDRLSLRWSHLEGGKLQLRSGKTGAYLPLTLAPALLERLQAARERRVQAKPGVVDLDHARPDAPLLWDETAGSPFRADWYRHVFMTVRDSATKQTASLGDFRDQDLRDTAVTWLARAGSSTAEIISITGHSEKQAEEILSRHYLGAVPERAAEAAKKLGKWVEDQGGIT